MGWTTFRDRIALLLLVGIPGMWLSGHLPASYDTGTMAVWTMVALFYFRKKGPPDG